MPALPSVPSTLRVAVTEQINAVVPSVSRFFIQYTGTAPTVTQLNTLSGSVMSAWVTDLAPLTDTSTQTSRVDIVDLTSPTAAVGDTIAVHLGTRTGSQLDAATAAVISYTVARRYRGGHPRGYWRFGTSTDLLNARTWNGTATTAFKSGIDAFFAAILAAGWSGAGTLTHVNVSYYQDFTVVISPTTGRARNVPTLRAAPVIDLITATIAQPSIGTQRRRNEFVD
jgi:hypothetical protein